MSNVWISKESWEKVWNALHHIQVRFSPTVMQPTAGISGAGASAQLTLDLPDRTGAQEMQWRTRVVDLGNNQYKICFFGTPYTGIAGTIRFRGKEYSIAADDCSFTVSKADLEAGDIYAVWVKMFRENTLESNRFFFAAGLTHSSIPYEGAETEDIRAFAKISWSDNHPAVYSANHTTLEWFDNYTAHGIFRADLACKEIPSSRAAFQNCLEGITQYLVVNSGFHMIINGTAIHGTTIGEASLQSYIALELAEAAGINSARYLYWVCNFGNGSTNTLAPVNARLEITEYRPYDSPYQNLRHEVRLPLLCLKGRVSNSSDLAYKMNFIVKDSNPCKFPMYWINTAGREMQPSYLDGGISISAANQKMYITAIHCFGNGSVLNSVPAQTISYSDTLPYTGWVQVHCRYNVQDDQWGNPYLSIGGTYITSDSSGVSGTEYARNIAFIQENNPAKTIILQNFAGPVYFESYKERIAYLKQQYDQQLSTLESSLGNRLQTLESLNLGSRLINLTQRVFNLENMI